jgi:hypothetical protein
LQYIRQTLPPDVRVLFYRLVASKRSGHIGPGYSNNAISGINQDRPNARCTKINPEIMMIVVGTGK